MNEQIKIIYDSLLRQFDGSQLIGTKELAKVLGLHRETVNRQRRELRGVPSQENVGRGAKIQYALLDVAEFIVKGRE